MPTNENAPIAITGLSCRFPGDGDNLTNFWHSICSGKSAWSAIPRDRLDRDSFNAEIPQGGHFLKEDISRFDANFFRISHNEACAMDPQQRLMLEVVYEALEAGGYPLEAIAGTMTNGASVLCDGSPANFTIQSNILAVRLEGAKLDAGYSLLIESRGATSCVPESAIRESEMAIVGGCNLMISPDMFIFEAGQKFLSPDGKCKTFDESADGYGRGEGFAAIILKRVDLAIKDGDPIRAVIRGSGSNQDGHTTGFTLPSAEAQASLIRSVYDQAGLRFDQTGYVEAHGTGTKAGDLKETTALSETIASTLSSDKRLLIGSVKSNIGHLEAAAGLAGVIKSVMMAETGTIPPNIHFHNPNPNIRFEEWKLKVPTELMAWPTEGLRRISINSFGYGGTNAHIILDDAQSYLALNGLRGIHTTTPAIHDTTHTIMSESSGMVHRVFTISAQDKDGIGRAKKTLAYFLSNKVTAPCTQRESIDYLDDLAFTLNERRSQLQWKTFVIASSVEELASALNSDETTTPVHMSSQVPRLGFVFTGQGAQWAQMGIDLMRYQTFRDSLEAADRYLKDTLRCEWSAVEELSRGKSTSKLRLALYSQTLCTVLQVALVDLLKQWGIMPQAVVGHSSGEIGAAYCLGALSREDAWKIAYYRGIVSSKIKHSGLDGAMLAVGSSIEEASEVISRVAPKKVHIACINSPKSVTLSGDADAIDKVYGELQKQGVFARKLQVDTAYHSPHMQIVARDYFASIMDVSTKSSDPECTMYSSVTGDVVTAPELGLAYWVRNLMSPVQFATAVQKLAESKEAPVDVLVEVGPHSALQGPSTQSLQAIGIWDMPYLSALTRFQNGVDTALNMVGSLYTQGYSVRFREINGCARMPRPLVDLPAYSWNHTQSHWAESRVAKDHRLRRAAYKPLLGAKISSFVAGEHLWRRRIQLSESPWIADHKIQGTVFYPAAGFIASAVEAALSVAEDGCKVTKFRLRDIQLKAALPISQEDNIEYLVSLRPSLGDENDLAPRWKEFVISSCRDGKTLERNCHGYIMIEYESKTLNQTNHYWMPPHLQTEGVSSTAVNPERFYKHLSKVGFQYGPAFQNITEISTGSGQSHGVLSIPNVGLDLSRTPHIIHPTTLDAAFHLVFAALGDGSDKITQATVPKSINEVVILADIPFQAGSQLRGIAHASRRGFKEVLANIVMKDEIKGSPILAVTGLCCTEVGGNSNGGADANVARSVCSKLVWRPAIGLLNAEELRDVVQKAVESPACPARSTHAAISELVKLMHHCNPIISISEIVVDKNQKLLCEMSDLVDVWKTASHAIWCPDESIAQFAQEACQNAQDTRAELIDLRKPLLQEISLQTSDVVFVPQSLSISEQVLRNAKQLLASGGRLCLTVPTGRSEDVKALGNKTGISSWVEIHDVDDSEKQPLSLLIGINDENTEHEMDGVVDRGEVIILQPSAPETSALAHEVQSYLEARGYKAVCRSLNDSSPSWNGKLCISLLEMHSPLLYNMSEAEFNQIKALILETGKILWVSGHGEPSSAMIDGLARVVRNEEPGLAFHTLRVNTLSQNSSTKIADLILRAFCDESGDNEYTIEDGVIHVSRVLEDDGMNDELHQLGPQGKNTTTQRSLSNDDKPLKLCVQNPGMVDSICFEFDDIAATELEEDEVEIAVKASSLSARDFRTVMGQLPDTNLGLDAAGIVRRVGSAVTGFGVGDRVIMCKLGAHRMVHRAKAELCTHIPKEMTFEEATSIPFAYGTAWYALMRLARAHQGQSILVTEAAGSIGQAAIRIAHGVGLRVFATVDSEDESSLLRTRYNIKDDHIFDSRSSGFANVIKQSTNGQGFDIVLNSLTGEALRQMSLCVTPFGTFIDLSIDNSSKGTSVRPIVQDVTYSSLDLVRIARERPSIMAHILQGVFELVEKKAIEPISFTSFPISDVKSALQAVEANPSSQVVLTFSGEQIVPCITQHDLSLELDPNAAYVLAGGLGGLGRSMAKMLIDHGARRLCFLSRSGAKSPNAMELVQSLQAQGVQTLVHACDITNPKAVQEAVETCSKELGPIRGVLQCALVLRDSLFRNMTYQQWVESTQPKIQGTWNLHQSLPDVDFFLSLGSFTAIFGNRGQSNYAAGGAYLDAIAHFRRAQGMHAVTIDFGVVRDVGLLAEQGMTNTLRDFEMLYGLDEDEFLNMVKLAIAGDISGSIAPQVLTGLATGGSAIAAGVEPAWYLDDAKFSIMAKTGTKQTHGGPQSESSVSTRLSNAVSLEDAASIVTDALVDRVASMLKTNASEIDPNRFLHSYGIDSLVAIQVVDWVLKECKAQITVLDVMAGIPITEIAKKIAGRSTLTKALIPT
ncbi:Highly reducing polyketide synthase ZEA2 [Cladobotryum mycophilum]|uniref:Highly reducing polyketide synthase ZEA2 n=1 Tax=Cladobotryum mycophilum TaxID=491253 RepID=A0ABR0SGT5_9HYPO